MEDKLLNLPVNELLFKFGAGEHKPGSGSAAALQGMLSAELICTVITLTLDPKRKGAYKNYIETMESAKLDIQARILPRLEELFQEDSKQFDRAIKLRVKRDNENDKDKRKKFSNDATEALIPSTEMPLEIARLCEDLAKYSQLIFEAGFKSARGDSGVALSGAVSAIGGCITIIDLNLLSFPPNKWTENIRNQTDLLRQSFKKFSITFDDCLNSLREELNINTGYSERIEIFKSKNLVGKISSNEDIERVVIQLQRIMWTYRQIIWKKDTQNAPLKILDPEKVIKIIGYDLTKETTLGQVSQGGEVFEVAGLIDNERKNISISEQFSKETQLFTTAHELGHAILHKQSVLHRDRPLDGSASSSIRDRIEIQADKFAVFFLMPKKQIKRSFRLMFLTDRFLIDESTAFALVSKSVDDLRVECKNLRGLSRKLASTEYYNAKRFISLAEQYRVSVEAMAIRLEELNLLEY